jgi:ferredoxin
MLKIELKHGRCTGHGRCYSLAPEVYDASDDGYCELPTDTVPDDLKAAASAGAAACPEGALSVYEQA